VLLHNMLGLEEDQEIFLAEEALEELITLPVTRGILEGGLDADDSIDIPGFGAAFHMSEPREFWLLLTDRYSREKILKGHEPVSRGSKCQCRKISGIAELDFIQALIEYYSLSLAGELLCDSCSVEGPPLYSQDRIKRLESLLIPFPKGLRILEVCCGDGMATQALLRLGHSPWSMDSDRCDLCQALKAGLMNPQRSFVMDARLLPYFFPPDSFDAVMGFMVGLIDRSNWPAWKEILLASSSLAGKTVFYTVYTHKEAELIAQALREDGWKGEIIDNRDSKGIYDQWAYEGIR
jgi:SAM-dependent methyltransferase